MYNLIFTSFAQHPCKTKEHRHTGWEIVCYLGCAGKAFIAGEEYGFQDGRIIIIPPNMPHYEIASGEMTIACFCIKTLFNLEHKVYSFVDTSNRDFLCLFKQLNSVYTLKPANWEKLRDGLLNVMEQYVLSWNAREDKNPLVKEFQYKLIEAISKKDIRMEDLLRNIPVSSSYFRKLFKAETGKSPMEYLLLQRVENAKQLMADTSLNIKNVANLSGFNDPYYFSRIFKKATGKYPSVWRKQM